MSDSQLKFPSEKDKARIDRYLHYDQLYNGDHFDAFAIQAEDDFTKRYSRLRYIVCNFPGLMSRIMADMLFGETITFDVNNRNVQDYIDNFLARNQLITQLHECAMVTSRRGDGLFKLRVGTRNMADAKPEVIAEEISAAYYFPEFGPKSGRNEPSSEKLVTPFTKDNKHYLHQETHTPGLIVNEVFEYDPKQQKIISTQNPVDFGYKVEEETGVGRSLLFHIPNFRDGNGFFGKSDYYDMEQIFFALNNRITKIDNILDKHSDPILAVPPGVLNEDGSINKSALGMFEVDNENPGFNKPEYIVWNANLESAFEQIDKLLDMAFMFSEIAPVTMGMDKDGRIESGRALKMKLLATIRKRNRKIRYFDQAIKDMLETAQQLAIVHGLEKLPAPERPSLTWGDGVVNDQTEMVEIATKRIDAGLSSRADEIARLDDITPAEAQKKVEEIDNEQAPKLPALTGGGGESEEDEDE